MLVAFIMVAVVGLFVLWFQMHFATLSRPSVIPVLQWIDEGEELEEDDDWEDDDEDWGDDEDWDDEEFDDDWDDDELEDDFVDLIRSK